MQIDVQLVKCFFWKHILECSPLFFKTCIIFETLFFEQLLFLATCEGFFKHNWICKRMYSWFIIFQCSPFMFQDLYYFLKHSCFELLLSALIFRKGL
eukprot:TRINITY_DN1218_c1_g1_i1.p2 TRINITY_DN1218_c1_g1~~TRINITY_DN1218_c1_g1_i1.p2  ORF type:complete len:112 (-),score=0.72 TRINITY_DN1218_c1_g1_i1:178-468(-)